PVGDDRLAVAGDAGALLDDGLPASQDPVHERRLADVRTADDRYEGQPHRQTPSARAGAGSSASRRATPSVATTWTGRGRSSGVVPSRKRPLERHTSGS